MWLPLLVALLGAPPCDAARPRCVQDTADACLELIRFGEKQPVPGPAAALCAPLFVGGCGAAVGELESTPDPRRLRELIMGCVLPEDCQPGASPLAVCGDSPDSAPREARLAALRTVLPRRMSPHLLPEQKKMLSAQIEGLVRALVGPATVDAPAGRIAAAAPPPAPGTPGTLGHGSSRGLRGGGSGTSLRSHRSGAPATGSRVVPSAPAGRVPDAAAFEGTMASVRAADLAIEIRPWGGQRTGAQLVALFSGGWPGLAACTPEEGPFRFVVEVPLSGRLTVGAVEPASAAPCTRAWISGFSGRDVLPKPEYVRFDVTRAR